MQIKIEERKLREEEFLIQFWLKVNPPNEETVDSSIVLEFLKLIYDPYIASQSTSNQEELVGEYVIAIRRLCNLDDQESEGEVLWSVPELLRALRYLTDNFASFKSGSSRGGIKVPSENQRSNFYEASKECTFKPAINKKSEAMERQHWANFFRD